MKDRLATNPCSGWWDWVKSNKFCQSHQTKWGTGHFGRENHPAEDLDRLKGCANKNHMKFTKDKCKVLNLGKHNPGVQQRLGPAQLGNSSVGRALGVLVGNKLRMSELCAAAAKKEQVLSCINKGREEKVIIPLYSALIWPHREFCVLFWSTHQKEVWAREGAERGHRDDPRIGKPVVWGKSGFVQPWEMLGQTLSPCSSIQRMLQRRWRLCFHKESHRKDELDKLFLGRFQLDTRGKLFIVKTISNWNHLLREVVDSSTLDTYKIKLDRVLVHLDRAFAKRSWMRWSLRPFPTWCSVILGFYDIPIL